MNNILQGNYGFWHSCECLITILQIKLAHFWQRSSWWLWPSSRTMRGATPKTLFSSSLRIVTNRLSIHPPTAQIHLPEPNLTGINGANIHISHILFTYIELCGYQRVSCFVMDLCNVFCLFIHQRTFLKYMHKVCSKKSGKDYYYNYYYI